MANKDSRIRLEPDTEQKNKSTTKLAVTGKIDLKKNQEYNNAAIKNKILLCIICKSALYEIIHLILSTCPSEFYFETGSCFLALTT